MHRIQGARATGMCQSVRITERAVPNLPEPLHPNPLVHRVLAARGITDATELEFSLAQLPRPDRLPNIDKAVSRLLQARERGERVLVVGDYDCDGATSTTVALLGLRMLGFSHVEFLIPSRFRFGYGLSPAIVDVACEQYQPDLILTVDNGVASVEGVQRAQDHGIDVVVTDHHLAPAVLPSACAIINPNMPGSTFPSGNLAGVGVIFYTLLAVRRALAGQGDDRGQAPLAELLDLVAIGTVADVVQLDGVNRILVEQGLRRIRAGRTRPGVDALLQVAGKRAGGICTQDIGFGIGPRLNAAGRLDDMSIGVRCLLAESGDEAAMLARELNDFNQQRRSIEQDMRASADTQLQEAQIEGLQDSPAYSVCLMHEHWHEGVIGILAGRIKERLNRPCVVFTADDDDNLKGSARSIKGVHIRDVLQGIVARHPGMIEKFGGHAMAAGLTLPRQYFELFRSAFEQAVCQAMGGHLLEREYEVDGSLGAAERTLENARLLARLMPWGQGFESPVFADDFIVRRHRKVGNGHLQLSLSSQDDESPLAAIAFNCDVQVMEGEVVHVVYSLEENSWRDRQQLQLRVLHLEGAGLR